ncbi:hypothetical protein Tco_0316169 [Tanacetum coccineum]
MRSLHHHRNLPPPPSPVRPQEEAPSFNQKPPQRNKRPSFPLSPRTISTFFPLQALCSRHSLSSYPYLCSDEEKEIESTQGTRLNTLTPSSDEMNKPWWKSSLEYFHNVSNAKVSREVHVRTDVHHYVDEGLSVLDLVKKIGDMQQEFQIRITALEQYVNQHKTSSTANDGPVNNVFTDTRDFDHDSFSSFTDNPDNRVALLNKITYIRVDFQKRITAIEQYLKISTSSNVQKPSCGSDNHDNHVKLRDKESMHVDRDVKTSFESDVDPKNVDNRSMDVDHDPKVVEQQNFLRNNLFDEFEHHVSSNNLINDEAIHNQLDTLSMNNADSLQGSIVAKVDVDVNPTVAVNTLRVPLEREVKVSRYLQSPYMIQPDSTKPNHKVRAKHNKVKNRCVPLTAPDGKLILA